MTHTVEFPELGGNYRTDLASSSKEAKRLVGVLHIDPGGSYGYAFYVEHHGKVVHGPIGLSAAIRAYNNITELT